MMLSLLPMLFFRWIYSLPLSIISAFISPGAISFIADAAIIFRYFYFMPADATLYFFAASRRR
jgi:hypothetical protein